MATVYKRQWTTPSGEEQAAYRVQFVHKGQRRQRQFKRLKDANAFAESLGTKDAVIPDARNGVTIKALANQWLKACARGIDGKHPLDAQSIVTYTGYVNNWIVPELGTKIAQRLTHKEVRVFRDWMLEQDIERSTVKKILTALKQLLTYGVLTDQIGANVATGVTVKMNSRHEERVVIPSKADVLKLLEISKRWRAEDKPNWLRYHAFLLVLVYCGLRLSEARGLPRAAFDAVESEIAILQRADKVGTIGSPKSARARRSLVVPNVLREALGAVIAGHNHALVFPTDKGNPLDAGNLGKRFWRPLVTAAKIPYVTMHTLRHFFASRLIEQGANVKEVSVALGHADEAFTLRVYGHLFKDSENDLRWRKRVEALI